MTKRLDGEASREFATEFFGEGEFSAVGVDGSMDSDERMQMLVFYSNATAYECPFTVTRSGMRFDLDRATRWKKLSASSAIPLWSEDVSDVLNEASDVEVELEIEHSIDRIPNAFMTLAEFHLALNAAATSRIVFLDRPISGTYSSLARDVRLLIRRQTSNLSRLGEQRPSDLRTILDISLALNVGAPSMRLPRRARYLEQRIIRELTSGEMSRSQLCSKLGVEDAQVSRAIKRLRVLDRKYAGLLFDDIDGPTIRLRTEVGNYWKRICDIATKYCKSVYEDYAPPLTVASDQWLTVLDISALAFVLLQRLAEVALERKVLLVGIAKDTTATDISRAVLPFAVKTSSMTLSGSPPHLRNDRAFLSILASECRELRPPWRTLGYDSTFSTMVSSFRYPDSDPDFRSARRFLSREGLFVRSFFQSRSMGAAGRIRSPVFLFDRLCYADLDDECQCEVEVTENFARVILNPYFEGSRQSRISNLVLSILAVTDNPEVYEAFGHNQLLYLADKAVKAEIRLMKSSLRGVVDLRLGAMSGGEETLGITATYREQRSTAETARMKSAQDGERRL